MKLSWEAKNIGAVILGIFPKAPFWTAVSAWLTLSFDHFHICSYTLLNSLLMMSLGAGALKVSGGPNAISREEVSMATLEAGTTPRAATN